MQWSPIIYTLMDAKRIRQRRESVRSEASDDSMTSKHSVISSNAQYSMNFLEMTLENSIESFLNWVAAHDFTAECVLFLMRVRNFRRNWQMKTIRGDITEADLRDLYFEAAEVFFELVEPHTSETPVNLSGRIITDLREQFKEMNCFCDFRDSTSSLKGVLSFEELEPSRRDSQDTSKASSLTSSDMSPIKEGFGILEKDLVSKIRVASNFNVHIFDKAYESVKEDVYRGAWPLYQDKFGRLHTGVW